MYLRDILCQPLPPAGLARMLLGIMLLSQSVNADPVQLPGRSVPDVMVISAERVIELLRHDRQPVLIDARIPFDRQRGYIEGSIGLSDTDTNCNSLVKISPDHGRPLMFYCNGPKCNRSERSIRIARQCGYKQVYWFAGGFDEWVAKRYPYRIGD